MEQSARATLRRSRLARGSAFARRRKCPLPYNYGAGAVTGREQQQLDAVISLDARRRTRRCTRASTVRPAHARRGRRRSVGTTARSRLGARSASPASALTEPSRRCDEDRAGGAVMPLDARRRTRRRARASTVRPANARRGRRRSVGTTTRSRLGARSASPVSALTEPNRRCNAGGAVMSLDTPRTRHGARVCRRHDRRTHNEVGGARSARRLARGSALARRRRCRL